MGGKLVLRRWHFVAAPKRSNGSEHTIDVLDWHGLQFFDQSVRIRIACSLRASWLILTASARLSPYTGRYVLVLVALCPCLPLQHSDEMTFTVCGALLSRDPVE